MSGEYEKVVIFSQ